MPLGITLSYNMPHMSFTQHEKLNLVLSGTALLQEPITREALDLTGKQQPNVLVVGTPKATQGDFTAFLGKAADHFMQFGLEFTNLHGYNTPPSQQEAQDKIGAADMVWITGGDTLKMVDFWHQNGITPLLSQAADSGTVMSGGSAGMLAWFEQGHSDSLSYRVKEGEPWDYMFVRGLGYLAATGCPHYDSRTGTAALRHEDFAQKFMADDSLPATAIGITNRAALAIHGQGYRVVTVPDSVKPSEVHILQKQDGRLESYQLTHSTSYQPYH